MTGDQFSGVDIDLLADYVGGALDGTPEQDVVATLVVDDPTWRSAYELLTAGVRTVRTDLHQLGTVPEPMPADVVARLDAALAAAPPPPTADDPISARTDRHLSAVPDPTDHARPALPADAQPALAHEARPGHAAGARPGATGGRPARSGSRRRLRRWAAPIAVAAGVLAFAGVGLGELLTGESAKEATPTGALDYAAPESAAGGARLGGADGAATARRITASGTDYRRDLLALAITAPGPAAASPLADRRYQAPAEDAMQRGFNPPPELARLDNPAALRACLEAIAAEHRLDPIAADSVDYASFEGSPALVVHFTAGATRWAWVSGPDCGTPGSGADTRYQVRVG